MGRECALLMLYGIDVTGQHPDWALSRFFQNLLEDDLDPPPPWAAAEGAGPGLWLQPAPEAAQYAELLVRGVHGRREELDRVLQEVSRNWRVARMALVDRNVLRLGAFELLHREDVPRRVAINEAIELAKRYGAAEARAFVNGVLDRVGRKEA